ncbi:MAG: hypothetical protein LBK42_03170 [Propionibacteriaceae bacterium]|jgi:uncharacterized delta-60 repeat protein|nr:hypothetical protein [Propionibacteriaceae bacterium]
MWLLLKSRDEPTNDPTPSTAAAPTTVLPTSTWAKAYGGQDDDKFFDLTVAADGSIFAAGYTGSTDGDITTNRGDRDALLAKIAPDGTLIWARAYGGTNYDTFNALAIAADGSLFAAGYTLSTDGDIITSKNGIWWGDALLAKIAPDGTLVWARAYGGASGETFSAVALADDGSVLAAGDTNSIAGDITTSHGGWSDALLAKIAPDGDIIWTRTYGGTNDDKFNALAVADDGDILAAGYTESDDGDITTNRGDEDALLAKIAPDGALRWTRTYGGTSRDTFNDLAVADDGDILAAGYTESDDGDITTNRGGWDALLVKTAPDGTLLWAQTHGGTDWDSFNTLVIAADGDILAAGYTGSTDGDLPPSHGDDDALLAKTAPDGTLVWARTHGGADGDSFSALAIAADGGLLAAGYTNSANSDPPLVRSLADLSVVKLTPNGELG